ncbi:MAG TPA: hypothetical protein EYO58_07990, partial [Flavobacteriales bacterium]|nr:hypothetical protein [Flavobacteriales bacterium]
MQKHSLHKEGFEISETSNFQPDAVYPDPPTQSFTTQSSRNKNTEYANVSYKPQSYTFTPTSTMTTTELQNSNLDENELQYNNSNDDDSNDDDSNDDDSNDDDSNDDDSNYDAYNNQHILLDGIDDDDSMDNDNNTNYPERITTKTDMNDMNDMNVDMNTELSPIEDNLPNTNITESCATANANTPILPHGYTYFPHTTWTVPQKRPPVCTAKTQPTVVPVYTSGVPESALEIQSSMTHHVPPTTYTSPNKVPEETVQSNSFYPGHTSVVSKWMNHLLF